MAQEDSRWREKYRKALAQQEQLETTLSAQQALLHRAVSTLTNAAEGQDTELDNRLSAIRASLKTNDVKSFDRMIKSLPRVIEDKDKHQEKQWKSVHKTLAGLAGQIPKLGHDSSTLKPAAKHFKKCIPNGILLPSTLQRLLEELQNLQTLALNQQAEKKGGLISRLFSKPDPDEPLAEQVQLPEGEPLDNDLEEAEWEEVLEQESDHTIQGTLIHAEQNDEDNQAITQAATTPPEAKMERPLHEPSFSRISDRVTDILTELLDYFPIVPCVEQKAVQARERIDRGLNWYELPPTLEDVRDFVIQAFMGADDEYRVYLTNVYQELKFITQALGIAIETEHQQRQVNQQFQNKVDSGLQNIHQAMQENDQIGSLKQAVESQVYSIQEALDQFKKEQQPTSNAPSLSDQLDDLVKRVKQMEKQDAQTREQLEQERKRAVTDNLTGLPNREAYSTRIHEEMLRWQRYQHPLTMAVIDIDFFKKFNDNYGHQTGDKVLKVVATSVAKRLREVDFIARFGGEEFVIVLPETTSENALKILNRIRERLANTPLKYKDEKLQITVSMGISSFAEGDNTETVFARADKALYQAKENGRNQCCIG